MERVSIGLIGAGRIGRIHAEVLTHRVPAARLLAVTDAVPANAERCAADFGIPRVAATPQELFADPAIQAVAICSSTDTHVPFIIQAAQAGKQIFCEKPIALDLAAVDQALAAVQAAGVKLQIGFNRRFHASFAEVRALVAAGKIGQPHLVRISSRDSTPPPVSYVKLSGGIFLDMTIHDFDLARFMIDSEVDEVYATGAVLVDPAIGAAGDIDTAVIVLRYANGAIATIDNSRQAVYGYDQRVEVFGSAGMALSANVTPHSATLYQASGASTAGPHFNFLPLYMDSYVAEMQAFVRAIQQDTAPLVTGQDGRYPLVMGLAAARSYRERRPVKLAEVSA